MTRQFTLPDLGEGVHEGQVMRLLIKAGDVVEEDQILMEVETDKAAVEIPSPYAGRITAVHCKEQEIVFVGNVMVTYDEGDGATAPPTEATETSPSPHQSVPTPPRRRQGGRAAASPSVRRLAREHGVDLTTLTGTGVHGRLTLADVEDAAAAPTTTLQPPPKVVTGTVDLPVPPAPEITSHTIATVEIPGGVEDTDDYGQIIRQPITQARRTISRVMSESWQTIPHVTDSNDADITELDAMRRSYKDAARPGQRLTVLAFVIRAVCRAIHRHPILNASIDETSGEIIYHRYVNIAIGVDTPRGLIAPVIRNTDQLTIGQLSDHLEVIAANARAAAFAVNDTRGGTYTISNAGAMGQTRYSTPIIMPPQVACLAVGRARKMPWVVDDAVVPRLILPLSHSMDHRLIDGGREIPFIESVIDDLEAPMRFMV
jgi:pyruvate/2-oxoglutarate dehydrogenase complex dihydrolipoamide acyltransferase (E2) component